MRPSFSDVLGACALTYVDFDSLLQEDEENGEGSAPESEVVERAPVSNGLIGRAWSSLGALVHVGGR